VNCSRDQTIDDTSMKQRDSRSPLEKSRGRFTRVRGGPSPLLDAPANRRTDPR
ncbi:uncharacterized protein METZ01_LOCUS310468, partial [marine metagenome]